MNPDPAQVDSLIDAIQQHHWPVAVGLGIALALYAANRANLLKEVPSKYTPAVAAVLGVLSAIGAQLATGMSWEEAIGKGFLAGAAATGLWEMVLKHVLKFPAVPAPEAKSSEEPASEEKITESVAPAPAPAPVDSSPTEAPPVKKARAPRKAKAAEKPVEAPTAASADASTKASQDAPAAPATDSTSATPKRRGRPRKNPEA